jgi:hypothetical protein
MTQAGVEELEGENKIPATQKSWRLLVAYTEMWNTTSPSQEETEWLFAPNYYV